MTTVRFNNSEGQFLFKIKYVQDKIMITSPLKIVALQEVKPQEKILEECKQFFNIFQEEPLEKLLENILEYGPTIDTYQQLFSILEQDLNIFKDDDDESLVMESVD